jgi:tetratricopeptide (TPR) repeat protein
VKRAVALMGLSLALALLPGCAPQATQKKATDKSLKLQPIESTSVQQWQDKISQWTQLLESDPSNPDAHQGLGEIYAKQYYHAQQNPFKDKALQHLRQVLVARPNDFSAQTLMYGLYYVTVKNTGSAADKRELQQLYTQFNPVLRTGVYPPSLADYLYVGEQIKKASTVPERTAAVAQQRQLLRQALHEQPTNGLLHMQISHDYMQAGKPHLGLAMMLQGQRLEPENVALTAGVADAYRSYAYQNDCVYDHMDAIKKSTQWYKTALAQNAQEDDVHWGLMVNYAHQGLAPLSIREGEMALAKQPSAWARWNLALFLSYQGQPEKAQGLFDTALKEQPQMPNRALVEHYMLQGQWQKAAEIFPQYISQRQQPTIADLIVAAVIRAEADSPSVTLESLWRTEKKAQFYSAWDEAIAKFWRRDISDTELKNQVKSSCQAADYEFLVGYNKLLLSKIAEAKQHFEKAQAYPQPMNFESRLAKTLLKSL